MIKLFCLALFFCTSFSVNAQFLFDGLWTMTSKAGFAPSIFIKFNRDSFELTNYRQTIQYGKGVWTMKNNLLTLNYDSINYKKSFVTSYSDSSFQKVERLLLTILVYDGFAEQPSYKPIITFLDSSNNKLLDIKADTSGKVITTLYHPDDFRKVKVNMISSGYDDSPVYTLSACKGKNLYLQFYINLDKKNYKEKSIETYKFRRTDMGDIILKDQTGKEFTFTQQSWKYGL